MVCCWKCVDFWWAQYFIRCSRRSQYVQVPALFSVSFIVCWIRTWLWSLVRLCLAFLALSCVGYAIPFIMCAAICCCFPCLISVLRLQEDLGQSRGATQELIDALPTYKFKPKRNKNWGIDHASSSENLDEGGILGPGTKKERVVSAEDAVSIFTSFSCLTISNLKLKICEILTSVFRTNEAYPFDAVCWNVI